MKMFTLLFCLLLSSQAFSAYVIVVNSNNAADISKSDVKKIFLGKKGAFSDGSNAIPVNLKEGDAVRGTFISNVLKKNEGQYVAYWSKMMFTGNGVPPQEVASLAEMKKLIAENPATVGFIDESMVDGSVKVIDSF